MGLGWEQAPMMRACARPASLSPAAGARAVCFPLLPARTSSAASSLPSQLPPVVSLLHRAQPASLHLKSGEAKRVERPREVRLRRVWPCQG